MELRGLTLITYVFHTYVVDSYAQFRKTHQLLASTNKKRTITYHRIKRETQIASVTSPPRFDVDVFKKQIIFKNDIFIITTLIIVN